MKKTFVLFSTILSMNASILPLISTTVVSAEEITSNTDTPAIPNQMKISKEETDKLENYDQSIQSFVTMQQKITDSMTVDSSNHYVYNETEIKNIIDSFDFESLNRNTDLNYTKDTFFAMAMDSIKHTEVKIPYLTPRSGKTYNVNAVVEVWNGKTFWLDYYHTKVKEKQFQDILASLETHAQGLEFIGSIPDIAVAVGPQLSALMESNIGALGSLFSVLVEYTKFACKSGYLRLVEENISDYGTVLDINKFTFVNRVWSQKDKPYQ
ncbi:hypothetical protein G8B50_08105 [Enterococcus durans]|uniref:hypothetical protein n=1 Tax=Enterococcus durans TaxID=53345 RepID=UPI0018831550|nr:hypothetical protein [Enterococcus durans]MBE9887633.1 hypothetical protein [Enterococcus durans]